MSSLATDRMDEKGCVLVGFGVFPGEVVFSPPSSATKEPYWIVLHDRIVSVISSSSLTSETEWVGYPFRLFDFTACHQSYSEMSCSYTLALAHAVWHHSSIGQLSLIPK